MLKENHTYCWVENCYYYCFLEVHCTWALMTMVVLPWKVDHNQMVAQDPFLAVVLVVRLVDHIVMILEVDYLQGVDHNNYCLCWDTWQ